MKEHIWTNDCRFESRTNPIVCLVLVQEKSMQFQVFNVFLKDRTHIRRCLFCKHIYTQLHNKDWKFVNQVLGHSNDKPCIFSNFLKTLRFHFFCLRLVFGSLIFECCEAEFSACACIIHSDTHPKWTRIMNLLFALALEEKLCHKLLLNVWQHRTNHLITYVRKARTQKFN